MSDGANVGVSAGRALETIVGGAEPPTVEETLPPGRVAVRVMLAPSPLEGPGAWERVDSGELERDAAYSLAADCIAKAFLLVAEDDPGVLTRETLFGPENTDIEDLWGKSAGANHAAWDAVKGRWPGFDDWIGGASGFQVGFALNTARYIHGVLPAPNPALVTIEVPDEPA